MTMRCPDRLLHKCYRLFSCTGIGPNQLFVVSSLVKVIAFPITSPGNPAIGMTNNLALQIIQWVELITTGRADKINNGAIVCILPYGCGRYSRG